MSYDGLQWGDTQNAIAHARGVYGLIDQRNGRLRYVGRTIDFHSRYLGHISAAKRSSFHTSQWINETMKWDSDAEWWDGPSIAMIGLDPNMSREMQWIQAMMDEGCDLLNGSRDKRFAATAHKKVPKVEMSRIRDEAKLVLEHAAYRYPTDSDGEGWLSIPSWWSQMIQENQAARREDLRRRHERMERERVTRRAYILGDELVGAIRGKSR